MPKKMGRPKLAAKDARGEVFAVRLRRDEARDVLVAIAKSNKPRPDWLREAILGAARKK
jgi:hypothetical protein